MRERVREGEMERGRGRGGERERGSERGREGGPGFCCYRLRLVSIFLIFYFWRRRVLMLPPATGK